MHTEPRMLRRDDSFLMVIDLQEPLMRLVCGAESVLGNVAVLCQAARILGVPVIATVQNRPRLGDLVPPVSEHLTEGLIVLDKLTFSCMRDPSIAAAIAATGRRQALLCGVETHICVSQTAHDLLADGYSVHVAADAVSSRTSENRSIALARLASAGAVVTSTESAVYEMLERASTTEFRALLPLFR